MKKLFFSVITITLLVAGLQSCKQKPSDADAVDKVHNSQNSLDWQGTYTGVIPCANCEGIKVQITLSDSTYQASYLYLGHEKGEAIQISGKFSWDSTDGTIILENTDIPPYYKVGENRLIQLDMEGNPITGELADMYVLTKTE
jgi:uncharacterized lipoprotein NlpE involved in copper resistance